MDDPAVELLPEGSVILDQLDVLSNLGAVLEPLAA
jgi:hypothetical protein